MNEIGHPIDEQETIGNIRKINVLQSSTRVSQHYLGIQQSELFIVVDATILIRYRFRTEMEVEAFRD